MFRTLIFGFLLCLLFVPALAQGQYEFTDPLAFGLQAQAKVEGQGQVTIRRVDHHLVPETAVREEVRTRTVEVNGERRTEQYTETVEYTVTRRVTNPTEIRLPAKSITAYDMAGKPAPAEKVAAVLATETTVLLATRIVPNYYLTVYKPDTLLLVIRPDDAYQHGIAAPAEGEAEPPAPGEAPAPEPVPVPAAPAAREVPLVPAEPAAAPANLPVSPIASLAQHQNGTVGLRHFLKTITKETVTKEVEAEGVKRQVSAQILVESISDTERKYPLALLKFRRADGKPVAAEELPQILAQSRCVLASTNGKEVDPSFLKIVRPEALIVAPPVAAANGDAGGPVAPVLPAPPAN